MPEVILLIMSNLVTEPKGPAPLITCRTDKQSSICQVKSEKLHTSMYINITPPSASSISLWRDNIWQQESPADAGIPARRKNDEKNHGK